MNFAIRSVNLLADNKKCKLKRTETLLHHGISNQQQVTDQSTIDYIYITQLIYSFGIYGYLKTIKDGQLASPQNRWWHDFHSKL